MKRFAICGKPVLHSKSPTIFNGFFRKLKLHAHYTRLAAGSAVEAIEFFNHLALNGMNVTAPFKQEIIPLLDEVDEAAKLIGAVNTVVRRNGRLIGFNTDFVGVNNALDAYDIAVSSQPCVVMGAGGAARSAIYALQRAGGNVTVVNRTFTKAQNLARTMQCTAKPMTELEPVVKSSQIILSTLAAGVNPLKSDWLDANQVVFDANYGRSALVDSARSLGCRVIDGHGWLVHQAVPVINHFTGQTVGADRIQQILIKGSVSDQNNNLVIVAKSPIGENLARHLAGQLDCSYQNLEDFLPGPPLLSQAGKAGQERNVFYLHNYCKWMNCSEYINAMADSIVVGIADVCRSAKPGFSDRSSEAQSFFRVFHYLDMVINGAGKCELVAKRIYDEYQHIQ